MKDILLINPLFFQALATYASIGFFYNIDTMIPWFVLVIAFSLSMYQEDKRKEENHEN